MITPRQLRDLFVGHVDAHDFVVRTHVRREIDRLAVLAPGGVLHAVINVGQQDLRRAAAGGNQEQLVVVIDVACLGCS